jgi:hypothetical protein
MKRIIPILLALLLFGCLDSSPEPVPNIVNGTFPGFSKYVGFVEFEFPSEMIITHKLSEYNSGLGVATVSGTDGDVLFALIYSNISVLDTDGVYSNDPQPAVREFLGSDSISDPAGVLINARDVSQIITYKQNDFYVAEVNFSISVLGADGESTYSGFAIDMYEPKKSALYRVRIISENGNHSRLIRKKFIESFVG